MSTYLEHANITVPDIDAAITFLQLIDPSFVIRHQGHIEGKHHWVHFGNDNFYIALQSQNIGDTPQYPHPTYSHYGVNHLAWVVSDFEAVIQRLKAANYRQGIPVEDHPFRQRAYFFDHAGFEWEIVHYLTTNITDRNLYDEYS